MTVDARAPRLWSWRNVLLVVSLAVNLAVLGVIGARFLAPAQFERLTSPSYTQLLPRNFLRELPAARRQEVAAIIKTYRKTFKDGREGLRQAVGRLADTLDAGAGDAAAIDMVSGAGAALIGDGAKLAKEIFAKLTPEERKLLARHLRKKAGVK